MAVIKLLKRRRALAAAELEEIFSAGLRFRQNSLIHLGFFSNLEDHYHPKDFQPT